MYGQTASWERKDGSILAHAGGGINTSTAFPHRNGGMQEIITLEPILVKGQTEASAESVDALNYLPGT